MTEQRVIQALPLVVLVWQVTLCWYLLVSDWPGWQQLISNDC
jgi:hypothetical protein